KIEIALMVFSLSVLCLLIVIEISMRTFFHSGLPWLEEFGRYVLVFGTFLGASIAIKRDEHPKMLALLQNLSMKRRNLIMALRDFALGCFLLVLDYYAWIQVLNMMKIGTKTSTLFFPLWVAYIILPVSIFVMGVRCFFSAGNNLGSLRGKVTETKGD
ncbi:MAG: TRAP transporter small permease subunit, partial [Deltaproteobacteria bacterium]|nr:TRAP transporter small permease subunit [Deltaproteobacteria bacterium]